jgi:hypothetical protein
VRESQLKKSLNVPQLYPASSAGALGLFFDLHLINIIEKAEATSSFFTERGGFYMRVLIKTVIFFAKHKKLLH